MRGAAGLLGFVWLAAVCFVPAARAQDQRILKLGVQLPLTGKRATVGAVIKNGVEMAIADINREGGGDGALLQAIYEDDQDTREGAVEAVRRLALEHRVLAIIGELFSPFVLVSRDIVEKEGVPYLTGGTNPRTTEDARWVFRVGASDRLLTSLLARYVVEELGAGKIALLHDATGIHNARGELLLEILRERYGIVPVVHGSWHPGDRDFTAQLGKVKASPAGVLIVLGETSEGGPFLRQAKELGLEALIIAHRDFGAREVLEEAGPAVEGVLIVTEYVPELLDTERRVWAQRYETRFGTPANVIAVQSYDAVLLLAEAIRRGGASREGVKVGLEQLKGFRGMLADYTFDEEGNGVHQFYVIAFKEGRPALVTLLYEEPSGRGGDR